MAISPQDLLGTPSDYATPDQIASVQQYANALMRGGQRDQPITSPWQGLRMMSDALSGNILRNRAGQQQMASRGYDAQSMPQDPMVGGQTSPMGGASQGPVSTPSPVGGGSASVRNNNPGAQWPGPIASQFGATGSQTIGGGNRIATFPDPVHGAAAEFALLDKRYSGMPLSSAVSKWSGGNSSPAYTNFITKRTGVAPGTVLSPELLRSPQGVALGKAMADWESGGKSPLNDQQWSQAHQLAFGGQTADLSGRIGGTSPSTVGSPQAMAGALVGKPQNPQQNTQMAAGGRGPSETPPLPTQGAPQQGPGGQLQPGVIPHRVPVTYEQMIRANSSPWMSPEQKAMVTDMYYKQSQPQQFEGPTGTTLIGPQGQQQFLGKTLNQQVHGFGGTEVPLNQQYTPSGALMQTPEAGQPPQAGGQPPTPPPQASGAGAGAPSPATGAPPTPLGVLPPQMGAPNASGIPGRAGQMLSDVTNFGLQTENKSTLNKADADLYSKNNDATMSAGTQANQGLPLIQMAKQAVQNPDFYSGFGADAAINLKRIKAAVGDDPNAAAANEVFEKFMAGDVLSQLRSKLQGLGQVRLAEIDLLSRATGNRYNTPAANLAVLNIIERSYNQMAALTKVANDYRASTSVPTNTGLNEAINSYLKANPTFQPEEIKEFNKTLNLDKKGPEPTTYTNSKAGQPPQKAAAPPTGGYDLTHPDLVPSIDEEMKRRGLK